MRCVIQLSGDKWFSNLFQIQMNEYFASIFRKRAWGETERYVYSSSEWSRAKCEKASFLLHKFHFSLSIFIIPHKRSFGVYWFVCLSIRLSVCLSVFVCPHPWEWVCSRKWVHGFFWIFVHSPSEDMNLEVSNWLNNFPSLYRLIFLFLDCGTMHMFEFILLILRWSNVLITFIYTIRKFLSNLKSCKITSYPLIRGRGGGVNIHFDYVNKEKGRIPETYLRGFIQTFMIYFILN